VYLVDSSQYDQEGRFRRDCTSCQPGSGAPGNNGYAMVTSSTHTCGDLLGGVGKSHRQRLSSGHPGVVVEDEKLNRMRVNPIGTKDSS